MCFGFGRVQVCSDEMTRRCKLVTAASTEATGVRKPYLSELSRNFYLQLLVMSICLEVQNLEISIAKLKERIIHYSFVLRHKSH
jgi:hypothetical protein